MNEKLEKKKKIHEYKKSDEQKFIYKTDLQIKIQPKIDIIG